MRYLNNKRGDISIQRTVKEKMELILKYGKSTGNVDPMPLVGGVPFQASIKNTIYIVWKLCDIGINTKVRISVRVSVSRALEKFW